MIKKWLLFLFLICLPLNSFALNIVRVRSFAGAKPVEAVDGMVIVKFASSASKAQKATAHGLIRGKPQGEIPLIGWVPVRLPKGMSVEEGLAKYRKNPHVKDVVPNTVYRPSAADPLIPGQYGLFAINAFAGWELEKGYNNVTIAIIDTGVDGNHPDLFAKIDTANSSYFDDGTGARTPEPSPTDLCGHGTRVAGIAAAAANNGFGISGVSQGARLLSLRVFTDISNCTPPGGTSLITVSSAIVYAVNVATNTPVEMVINISLGDSPGGPCNSVMEDAIDVALLNDVVVVAAAGNQGALGVECPARIDKVIAVGATDPSNSVASFSARGTRLDIVAPGVNVLTTKKGDGFEPNATGTSFASPHVAGVAALLLSASSTLTTDQIIAITTGSAKDLGIPGWNNDSGWGLLNSWNALSWGIYGSSTSISWPANPSFKEEKKVKAFPNPYRVSAHRYIRFDVPPSIVLGFDLKIKIYTMAGEIVRTLDSMKWNGRNDSGSPVASGVYIFRAKSSNGSGIGRFALIR